MQQEPRTHWALIVIIIVGIIFGLFWYSQKSQILTPPSVSQTSVQHTDTFPKPDDLQASAEAIVIPEYSNE
jgi:hypothetical protein